MKIRLDENFEIYEDARSWNLVKTHTYFSEKKQKDVVAEETTYHATVRQCLNEYLKQSCKDLPNIEELINRYACIESTIANLKLPEWCDSMPQNTKEKNG